MQIFPANFRKEKRQNDESTDPIGELRKKLAQLEAERRFSNAPYPPGLREFPWLLTGRGFFPAGDGMWREPYINALSGPAKCPFPFKGIMFLGQDFGSLQQYPPIDRPYELDNVLTWRSLVERLKIAKIDGRLGFYTNALLGLRIDGSSDGRNPCLSNEQYIKMSREFLSAQIQIQNPQLIVIFGSVDASIYTPLLSNIRSISSDGIIVQASCEEGERVILKTQHPRSDSGVITKNHQSYRLRCMAMSQAWDFAQKLMPS